MTDYSEHTTGFPLEPLGNFSGSLVFLVRDFRRVWFSRLDVANRSSRKESLATEGRGLQPRRKSSVFCGALAPEATVFCFLRESVGANFSARFIE